MTHKPTLGEGMSPTYDLHDYIMPIYFYTLLTSMSYCQKSNLIDSYSMAESWKQSSPPSWGQPVCSSSVPWAASEVILCPAFEALAFCALLDAGTSPITSPSETWCFSRQLPCHPTGLPGPESRSSCLHKPSVHLQLILKKESLWSTDVFWWVF